MPPSKGKPAQAGKFKPRKKAAKRPGSSSVTPGSSISNKDAKPDAASSSGAAKGRISSRDRRPGGKKKFTPIPSGQVFFTGGANDDDAKKRKSGLSGGKSGGSKGSGTGKKGSKGIVMPSDSKLEENEVIVGELAEAIGQKAAGKEAKSILERETKQSDYEHEYENQQDAAGSSKLSYSLTEYDSDTSDDDDDKKRRRVKSSSTMQPTQLPFPTPAGAQALYPTSQEVEEEKKADDRSDTISVASVLETHEKSKDWFLLQLPTRLPIGEKESEPQPPRSEPESVVSSTNAAPVDDEVGDHVVVSTPAIQPNSFDQTLTGESASSGVFGKLRLYESGRSTLVINGVELDLDRGLPCGGMAQHAVVIDKHEADYIVLGSVTNTIVATPKIV